MVNRMEPIAAVILAAGGSTRMGQPKLLLTWKGETLIRHTARIALDASLDPVVAVTGAYAEEVNAALTDVPVKTVHNLDWQSGQSTSVAAGIRALPAETRAVFFLLGDQPFISVELLQAMTAVFERDRPLILAPFVGDRRANPALFDRSLFDRLTSLKGDAGARSIFHEYPPVPFPWADGRILFDVDTPEDYRKLSELDRD